MVNKKKWITFRTTPSLKRKINKRARELKVKKATYIRNLVLEDLKRADEKEEKKRGD